MSKQGTDLNRYSFFWSPEGRHIITFPAVSLARAKSYFRSKYRASYGRYMGEVYVEVNHPNYNYHTATEVES